VSDNDSSAVVLGFGLFLGDERGSHNLGSSFLDGAACSRCLSLDLDLTFAEHWWQVFVVESNRWQVIADRFVLSDLICWLFIHLLFVDGLLIVRLVLVLQG
jgi:cellulose synthase/poly-beta-1,6-N-acetylglucosamine synthase-like glycosyltransferase